MTKIQTLVGTVLVLAVSVGGFVAAQEDTDTDARPWLGISILDSDAGVTVASVVPDSPAAEAGVEAGDVVTAFNDEDITSAQQLVDLVQQFAVGDEVSLDVTRDDETMSFDVTLSEFPDQGPAVTFDRPQIGGAFDGESAFLVFGLVVNSVDEGYEVADKLPIASDEIQEGDIITAINGESVVDMEPQDLMVELIRLTEPAELTILRDGEEMTITVESHRAMLPRDNNGNGNNNGNRDNNGNGRPHVLPRANRAFLGVQFDMLTEDFATNLGITTTEGALIKSVQADSPAEEAGLMAGDIITAIDGEAINADNPLNAALQNFEPDQTATLTVVRTGEEQEIEVTFGQGGFGSFFQMMPDGLSMDADPYNFFDFYHDFQHGDMPFMPNMPFGNGRGNGRMDIPRPHIFDNMFPDGATAEMVCRDEDGNIVLHFNMFGDNADSEFVFPEMGDMRNLDCSFVTGETPDESDAPEQDAPSDAEPEPETDGENA